MATVSQALVRMLMVSLVFLSSTMDQMECITSFWATICMSWGDTYILYLCIPELAAAPTPAPGAPGSVGIADPSAAWDSSRPPSMASASSSTSASAVDFNEPAPAPGNVTMADSHRKNLANLKNGQGEHTTVWTAINGKCKASQWIIMHKVGGKVKGGFQEQSVRTVYQCQKRWCRQCGALVL